MVAKALAELARVVSVRSQYDNFIGGKWVAPVREQYFDKVSPVNGKAVCAVARSTAEDIELALDAAHAAKEAWGEASYAERSCVRNKIFNQRKRDDDRIGDLPPWAGPAV